MFLCEHIYVKTGNMSISMYESGCMRKAELQVGRDQHSSLQTWVSYGWGEHQSFCGNDMLLFYSHFVFVLSR